MPSKYDIKNESFDLYFIKQLLQLTEAKLEDIPMDIQFKYKSDMTPDDIKSMSFAQKLYILSRFCKKRVTIVVENEEGGLSADELVQAVNREETFDVEDSLVRKMFAKGVFAIGNEQVLQSVSGLEQLSNSPVYKYINGLRSGKVVASDYDRNKIAVSIIGKFLQDYEGYKSKLSRVRSYGAEKFLLLMYYSDGKQKSLAGVYNSARTVQKTIASRLMIEMSNAKWFISEGKGKNQTYRITVLGYHQLTLMMRDIVNSEK